MQELGEAVHACARRELEEETGILAEPVATLTVLDVIRPDEAGRIKTHFALVCVLLDWRLGEGKPIQDAHAVRWVTLAEAQSLDTFPDAVPVMRLALAQRAL